MRSTNIAKPCRTTFDGTRKALVLLARLCTLLLLTLVPCAQGQNGQISSTNLGSVPSGAATNEVVHLTLRDAINMAARSRVEKMPA